VGIGLNQGIVLQGDIGTVNRKDFTIIGKDVNLTARLCQNAKAGQILITQDFYSKIKQKNDIVKNGSFKFKGFEQEIITYNIVNF